MSSQSLDTAFCRVETFNFNETSLPVTSSAGRTFGVVFKSHHQGLWLPTCGERGGVSGWREGAAGSDGPRVRLLSALGDLEVSFRELTEMLAISRNQKLLPPDEENQAPELLLHRDGGFRERMKLALNRGKIHPEMQVLEKGVEKRDGDIPQLQKPRKAAGRTPATAGDQALMSTERAREAVTSSAEVIKDARGQCKVCACALPTWVPGPVETRPGQVSTSGLLGQADSPCTNSINSHLPGDTPAAGSLTMSLPLSSHGRQTT